MKKENQNEFSILHFQFSIVLVSGPGTRGPKLRFISLLLRKKR